MPEPAFQRRAVSNTRAGVVDHQFQLAGFDKKRLFYTQGDYGLFQCSKPCCDKTWDNEDAIRAMMDAQRLAQERDEDAMVIPHELLPTCPYCGAPATMNLRADETFVEDEGWHEASLRFDEFIRRHEGLSTIYLELGVGMNTPAIIKFPFWKMTARNRKAHYAIVNKGEAFIPDEIIYQSTVIDDDDAGLVLEILKALRKGESNEPRNHESRGIRA